MRSPAALVPPRAVRATELASLRVPALVVNYYSEPGDGMHTPAVARALAAAIPAAEPAVVSPDPQVWWFGGVLPFLARHSGVEHEGAPGKEVHIH
eukprot:522175-Prymnesium_polylepis.1